MTRHYMGYRPGCGMERFFTEMKLGCATMANLVCDFQIPSVELDVFANYWVGAQTNDTLTTKDDDVWANCVVGYTTAFIKEGNQRGIDQCYLGFRNHASLARYRSMDENFTLLRMTMRRAINGLEG